MSEPALSDCRMSRRALRSTPMPGQIPVAVDPINSWKVGSHIRLGIRHLVPLRYSADLRSLAFLLLLLALYAVEWTGFFRHWLLLPVTCVLAFTACIIKHNHIHC